MSLIGVVPAVAGVVYGRKYVSRIVFDDTTKRFQIHTLTLFGSRQHLYEASEIRGGRYHHGRMGGRITVNAPWWTVRVGAERVPLIIDAQGHVLDDQRFRLFRPR